VNGLEVAVLGAEVERFAAVPTLSLQLRLTDPAHEPVHAAVLRAQVRIEPERRRYQPDERTALAELFGNDEQWATSLRPFLWTELVTSVGRFEGSADLRVPMTCTYDFEVAAARYLHAVREGEVPLVLLFSGTVFRVTGGRLAVEPVPWSAEARLRLPVATWRAAMDRFFPGSGWIRLPTGTIDALARFKTDRALATWDATLRALLACAGEEAS
jgi:hypothetical protein